MGMAASQARFLSLTARKSNTEYEGQQINQERTALANESSNLYAQLTKLDVPTPPATSDFYKTTYSFTTSDLTDSKTQTQYSLETIQSTVDGDIAICSHQVKYHQATPILMSGACSKDPNSDTPGYRLGDITKVDPKDKTTSNAVEYNLNNGMLSGTIFSHLDQKYAVYIESVDNTKADDVLDPAVYASDYTINGVTGKYMSFIVMDNQKYYLANTQLAGKPGADTIEALQNIKEVPQTKNEEFPVERYETNELGRITTVVIKDKEGVARPYTLSCTTVQDEVAYEQAMRDYEYYQAKYEKSVADINAKTEDIQQKDKTLELELKQLDTEQNAIKTEMDAVQKVVEDNVESTFKTFG